MFKTVKSKILLLLFIMLVILMATILSYAGVFRIKTKQLMLKNYSFSVNNFVEKINKTTIRTKDNSKELSLIGKLFYLNNRNYNLTEKALVKSFENYENSLGGGIWFEPYVIEKNKKRVCFYAYRDKNNNIIFDKSFSSEEYDYHNKSWYKEITSEINKDNDTSWSTPYFESQGSEKMMITVGTGMFDNDKLIGISTVDLELNSISNALSKMKPFEDKLSFFGKKEEIKGSFSLLASKKHNYIIASNDPYLDNSNLIGKTLDNIPWYNDKLNQITYFKYQGKTYAPFVKDINNGMILIICIPKDEMYKDLNKFSFNALSSLSFFGLLILLILYLSLNKNIVKPINELTNIAKKISEGEDKEIKIKDPEEFSKLAFVFNKMTKDIKNITKERERINSELNLASLIQQSSLPNALNPFPERSEIDIFALIKPAKEIGGDFYDFYFVDENKIMFFISDVSGKGIPASLFMMKVKAIINILSKANYKIDEFIKIANNQICKDNNQNFFATMLMCVFDIKDEKMTIINCGHNKPLIKKENGAFEFLSEIQTNIPLGIFENTNFEIFETDFKKEDCIFIYTDGVTEAFNQNNEMYGEERLQNALNKIKENNVKEIINNIKNDVKIFSEEIEQSDDITMLCFKYNGKNVLYNGLADIENYNQVQKNLEKKLDNSKINKEVLDKIFISTEEIYANISYYAYKNEKGDVKISFEENEDAINLIFEDNGFEYNPLEQKDPSVDLPIEDRKVGGLGIFMVKNMADDVLYKRENNKNILKISFKK